MTQNERSLLAAVQATIREGGREELTQAMVEFASMCFKTPGEDAYHTDDFVRELCKLLVSEPFRSLDGSSEVLLLIEYDWAVFSEAHRTQILDVLDGAFGQFAEWLSDFLVSEILGEYFASPRAYEILVRLADSSEHPRRAVAPHGLEHLVKYSDGDLAARAMKKLVALTSDGAEEMRVEAQESLARIQGGA